MSRNSKLAALIVGAAFAIGGPAPQAFAALCGDVNNSGGGNAALTCYPASGDACDTTDAVGVAQVLLAGPCPGIGCIASQCGGAGSLDCADLVDDGAINSQDLVASLQLAAGIPPLLQPCSGFGPTIACNTTVSGTITQNQVWPGAGCVTKVNGTTLVARGVTITMQAGAIVQGIKGAATPSAVIFLRGDPVAAGVYTPAKINTLSTPASPIVMTSDQTPGTRLPADWGGLVLNGAAPVNFAGGEGSCEGLAPGVCNFGGQNPNDSSGQVRYVRVEFSGIIFSPDNELNNFTQNGVGRGTTVEFVQANVGNDDGIEWFGGTVNGSHLVTTAAQDDGFDWQIGWTGSVQYGLALQNATIFSASGQNGFEGDNNEFGFDLLPRSNPKFCNMTMIGCRQNSGFPGTDCTGTGSGALLRRGTAGKIANAIVTKYRRAGLELTQDETIQQGCTNATTLKTTEPVLRVQDTILYDNGGGAQQLVSGSLTSPPCTASQLVGMWQATEGLNITATNPLPSLSGTYPTTANTDQFFPVAAGIADNAPDCTDLDSSFESTDYIGAFVPGGTTVGGDNWLMTAGGWISFGIN